MREREWEKEELSFWIRPFYGRSLRLGESKLGLIEVRKGGSLGHAETEIYRFLGESTAGHTSGLDSWNSGNGSSLEAVHHWSACCHWLENSSEFNGKLISLLSCRHLMSIQ